MTGNLTITSNRARSALVGRQREMAELQGGLEAAVSGCGRLFLIVGEPGIGKTRLAEELEAVATRKGTVVRWGRCWENGGAPAYWPWTQIMRSHVRGTCPEVLAAQMGAGAVHVAEILPELRERVAGIAPSSASASLEPERARFELFDATANFLKSAARQRPLVLLLDDLHAADASSLLFLQFLARDLRDGHILVIGTYREVEARRAPTVAHILGGLAREARCLPLGGLDEGDVRRLIETVAGLSPAQHLVARIHRTTEGNPFFVDEVVRLLIAEGRLQDGQLRGSEKIGIPEGVRRTIRRRLEPLSDACKRILRVASVAGREFDLVRMERACGVCARRLLQLLAEALEAGILTEVSATLGRFSFSHGLVQETLFHELPLLERLDLHRRIGEVIEEVYHADLDRHLTALAHHYLQGAQAGTAGKAIEYSVRAGARATAMLAYEEAIAHYRAALQALRLGERDEPRHCELLLSLAAAYGRAGQPAQARQAFLEAADRARQLRAPEQLARAALGFAGKYTFGVVDEQGVRVLEEARAALGEGDSALGARVLARLSEELYFCAQAQETRATLSQQAIDMARRVGDRATLAHALRARHYCLLGPEHTAERLAVLGEILQVAGEAADWDTVLDCHDWRIYVFLELGDLAAVDREICALGRLAKKLRQPSCRWYEPLFRAMRALLEGRFEQAEQFIYQALTIGQQVEHPDAVPAFGVQLSTLRREQGRLGEVVDAVQGFVETYPKLPAWRAALALILSDLHRETEARREFEVLAANDFVDIPRDANWLNTVAFLAVACAYVGDARRAAVLYGLLLPYAGRYLPVGAGVTCYGSVSHYLGLLAMTMKRRGAAARHFQAALDMNRRIRASPCVARTLHAYGRMLLSPGSARPSVVPWTRKAGARRRPGLVRRHDKAMALLREAVDTASALGMQGLADEAVGLMRYQWPEKGGEEAHVQLKVAGGGNEPEHRAIAGRQQAGTRLGPSETEATAPRMMHSGAKRAARIVSLSTQRTRLARRGRRPAASEPPESLGSQSIFRRDGEFWTTVHQGRVVHLKDGKGPRYIAQLLRYPNREFHVIDLVHAEPVQVDGTSLLAMREASGGAHCFRFGDAGPMLDPTAKAAYRRRLEGLSDALEDAKACNDPGRIAPVEEEIHFITEELARAAGLGRRDRRAASQVERARVNVTKLVKLCIKKISGSNPALGRYFTNTIKTGTFCSYSPDPSQPISWEL
ncbi:MAG: AAA family ATPase [Candidatus Binatia bacterium]